ncbi:hypothetical protein M422DRAFT_174797 [Sphaerobolus stellatus SS14]|uniref:Unplaced genomic scaffold SPHSTscaffold_75, whole genome shotgun sequence n=1 Tax=Sphaerobolus stellatus (strain SS14) TaxID=990650 RepID=A0A0C9U977_SPHS4|nr:hypothetical protein M422DRAFT_174797 [Sphaerobolus stellatus SS14]
MGTEADVYQGYLSDISDGDWIDIIDEDGGDESDSEPAPSVLPPKRRKLEVSVIEERKLKQEECEEKRRKALKDIEKLIASQKNIFGAGRNGLQSYRARAIQSCLWIMLTNKKRRGFMEASERAAESQGFAADWGGRMVRSWVNQWINSRELPKSKQGCHSKVYSLLDDPEICTELRSYLRSNKWSMNPQKLMQFSKNQLIPTEADKYLHHIVNKEMPEGLKKYMELELFPRIQMKVAKGVAISTARPQSNDSQQMSWVWKGEQPLKKKGIGRGLHQSDFICSTVGWLKEASQTLEYGKNYDGYWNGELFVKQLKERFFPAFEKAHGPGYQALVLVDNSQGHSAYAEDALLSSRMNMRPGGKQAQLRDGWFMKDGQRVIQQMNFPANHPEFPSQPKGMREILIERGYLRDNCDGTFRTLQENMGPALSSVSILTIRRWELHVKRWIAAYGKGMDAKEAQAEVRRFSSHQYKSHRRVFNN